MIGVSRKMYHTEINANDTYILCIIPPKVIKPVKTLILYIKQIGC